jgi:hypothetical protein
VSARVGDRVEFLGFGEPDVHSDLKPGTHGKVEFVDDAGTIHVAWDDGHRLGLVTRPWPRGTGGAAPIRPFRPDRFRVISGVRRRSELGDDWRAESVLNREEES